MTIESRNNRIRLVAVMEAASVTGPAKNMIAFFRSASRPDPERSHAPILVPSFATFVRGPAGSTNDFIAAVMAADMQIEIVTERFPFDLRALFDLRDRITKIKPDLIQTHNVKSHFLVRLSGLHRSIPWIAFQHGYTATNLKMRGYNQLDRWSLSAAQRVVTVCGPFAKHLQAIGVAPSRIRVLHNSVHAPRAPSPEIVADLRRRFAIPPQASVVLSVGRFSREKAQIDLVRAFALLCRLNPNEVRLLLVGDGPERQHLESAARDAGISGKVAFAGQVSDAQPFYAMAAVLALPSLTEGSPNVVLEAMAARLPIVATAVGGVPELLENNVTGLLVPPRTPAALAEGLARLLSDPTLAERFAARSFARVIEAFTPDAYRRSLLDIYREVLH